jgi:hypothetical protein
MGRGCLILLAGLFVISVAIAAIARSPVGRKTDAQVQVSHDATEAAVLTETAHQLMLAELKDPDSARFNYDLPRASGLFCGTVRAKNSLGGYGNDTFYILFPFGLIDSEQEGSTRFGRLWNLYCVDRRNTPKKPVDANRLNSVILQAKGPDRAWMLGRMVGDGCVGRTAFLMGSGSTGIRKSVAFWSARCSNGSAYEVGIWPDQAPRVLECRVPEQLHAGRCFQKLSSDSSNRQLDRERWAMPRQP